VQIKFLSYVCCSALKLRSLQALPWCESLCRSFPFLWCQPSFSAEHFKLCSMLPKGLPKLSFPLVPGKLLSYVCCSALKLQSLQASPWRESLV
jgi:hypothetical protein